MFENHHKGALLFITHMSFCKYQLAVSSFFLWKESQSSSPPRMNMEWKSIRLFPIPSIIYLIHNNVQFATLTYVDPSTYQIMGNLKIVTTGILFRYWASLCIVPYPVSIAALCPALMYNNLTLLESIWRNKSGSFIRAQYFKSIFSLLILVQPFGVLYF